MRSSRCSSVMGYRSLMLINQSITGSIYGMNQFQNLSSTEESCPPAMFSLNRAPVIRPAASAYSCCHADVRAALAHPRKARPGAGLDAVGPIELASQDTKSPRQSLRAPGAIRQEFSRRSSSFSNGCNFRCDHRSQGYCRPAPRDSPANTWGVLLTNNAR